VVGEVLPSIRKHGAYLTPEKVEEALLNPDVLIRLATDLKSERERRLALEAQIQDDRPKVLFADAVSASSGSILVRELAKLLRQNGVDIGGTRLFEWLRREGFLIRDGSDRNSPTQRSMDAGLMTVHETVIQVPDKAPITRLTPRITGKGQRYFVARFQREQPQSKAPVAAEGVM
jgi:phage antirepressor YoqD-like protein